MNSRFTQPLREYRWRNPVTGKIEHKHAYMRKVGEFLVAVGYYSG